MTEKNVCMRDTALKNGTASPRRRRKEARPGEIIKAGLLEFAERGFAGAKLEDVAKRAGVSKGTIYLYFENKEALFEAALKAQITPVFDNAAALVSFFPGSSTDLLRALIPPLYQNLFTSDILILMRIIIAEGARFPQIAELYYKASVEKGEGLIRKIVERGVEQGEFRDGAIARQPMVALGPAIMFAVWQMTFNRFKPIDPAEFLAAHLELVLDGLRV